MRAVVAMSQHRSFKKIMQLSAHVKDQLLRTLSIFSMGAI